MTPAHRRYREGLAHDVRRDRMHIRFELGHARDVGIGDDLEADPEVHTLGSAEVHNPILVYGVNARVLYKGPVPRARICTSPTKPARSPLPEGNDPCTPYTDREWARLPLSTRWIVLALRMGTAVRIEHDGDRNPFEEYYVVTFERDGQKLVIDIRIPYPPEVERADLPLHLVAEMYDYIHALPAGEALFWLHEDVG